MYFTWIDVEIGEIYRQECLADARNHRLLHASGQGRPLYQRYLRLSAFRLGQLLESLGHNLQGLPIHDAGEIPRLSPQRANDG
jgi:hypothetical protein